jgi:hypothetical protein
MIYSTHHRFAFVHIPRTGGLSLTRELAWRFIDDCVVDTTWDRHPTAADMRRRIGPAWRGMFKFSIMRSPWEIIESFYRLCLRDSATTGMPPRWASQCARAAGGTFEEFVHREFLSGAIHRGGFWKTWGASEVEVFQYPGGQAILDRLGIGRQLTVLNSAPDCPAEWTPRTIDAVRMLCCEDFRRFGYQENPLGHS